MDVGIGNHGRSRCTRHRGSVAFGGSTIVSAAEGLGVTILQHRGGPGGRGFMGGDVDHSQRLADALGITVDELEAAQESAHEAAIAQAIEDGGITQEQADEMQAQATARESDGLHRPRCVDGTGARNDGRRTASCLRCGKTCAIDKRAGPGRGNAAGEYGRCPRSGTGAGRRRWCNHAGTSR